jgi:cellulase (glycosyl hydrolase family 5)
MMKTIRAITILPLLSMVLLCVVVYGQSPRSRPVSLHPENPHYFMWRGKPAILITSGEHYGAVLNLDFDYVAYLDALAKDRLNNTRIFTGAYAETIGNFKIVNNTLAPAPNRLICPWARSGAPGYAGGGDKFDLTKWDERYFDRLRDFVAKAGARGVVVEVNLFCPFYEDSMWRLSPMNARNNINGVGDIERTNVYTLDKHGGLLPVQEAMTRKIVAELNDFDNVYYEICNEPYFGGVTTEWQRRIADVIADAQKDFPHKFLISQNIANGSQKVTAPHPAVSIFNFHYATPPDAVALNYDLNKVIGDNETGFRGTGDDVYRMEAWDFIVAGGALYNNLDYSFTVEHPNGTWTDLPETMPGGGGPALRRQLRILQDFISGFDFIRMKPDNQVILGGAPSTMTARALVERGKAYAIYVRAITPSKQLSATEIIHQGPTLALDLPAGCYRAEWIDTKSGAVIKRDSFKHGDVARRVKFPDFKSDIALRLNICRK